ncbi:MAG: hypothetical protein DRG78_02785 [Epsilonproteobacteria bacterium]|nr:MAG: hypothetical protein DRG78_02785 [Campylobacterota bacterium]
MAMANSMFDKSKLDGIQGVMKYFEPSFTAKVMAGAIGVEKHFNHATMQEYWTFQAKGNSIAKLYEDGSFEFPEDMEKYKDYAEGFETLRKAYRGTVKNDIVGRNEPVKYDETDGWGFDESVKKENAEKEFQEELMAERERDVPFWELV